MRAATAGGARRLGLPAGGRPWGAGWGLLALLTVTLAGCGGSPADPPPSGATPSTGAAAPTDSTTPPAEPSATAPGGSTPAGSSSATPNDDPRGDAVVLVRSGGFAGRTTSVTVRSDGSWTGAGGRTGRLDAAQRSRLHELVADPGLAEEAARRFPATTRCRDTYTYQLTVGNRRIRYTECPGQVHPPEVTMKIAELLLTAVAG